MSRTCLVFRSLLVLRAVLGYMLGAKDWDVGGDFGVRAWCLGLV